MQYQMLCSPATISTSKHTMTGAVMHTYISSSSTKRSQRVRKGDSGWIGVVTIALDASQQPFGPSSSPSSSPSNSLSGSLSEAGGEARGACPSAKNAHAKTKCTVVKCI